MLKDSWQGAERKVLPKALQAELPIAHRTSPVSHITVFAHIRYYEIQNTIMGSPEWEEINSSWRMKMSLGKRSLYNGP